MANFSVSYKFIAVDRFSEFADKARRKADRLKQSVGKLGNKVRRTSIDFKKLGGDLQRTGLKMALFATVPIGLLGRGMVKAGSDAVETANKFNQVFDTVEAKANSVAGTFSKEFGVARSTAQKMLGDTGDLLVGFGFTGDAALEMSRKVNELASDLNSFQNFEGGAAGASIALTKALLGESESAKALGIVIRQGTPEFKKNVAVLQRSQKVTLLQAKAIEILRIATSQSQKAIGDVSRTWDDYASVARRSDEASKKLRETFGLLLLPTATKLTNALIGLTTWLTELSPTTQKVLIVVAGLIAVVGPLLLVIGSLIAVAPLLVSGFTAVAAAVAFVGSALGITLAPFLAVTAAMAAAWAIGSKLADKLSEFPALWDAIGEGVAKVVDFFGFGDESISIDKTLTANQTSTTDINVNVNAPHGAVSSVQATTQGRAANVGTNLKEG